MRRTIQQALILVFGGAAFALLVNTVSPRHLSYLRENKATLSAELTVSLDEAEQLWNTGTALFLDARAPEDYAAGHIAGALNLPAEKFDQHYAAMQTLIAGASQSIVYCGGGECDLSHTVADRLRSLNHPNVKILQDGWIAWQQRALPSTTGTKP